MKPEPTQAEQYDRAMRLGKDLTGERLLENSEANTLQTWVQPRLYTCKLALHAKK